jgi:hypothetical protein
VIQLEILAIVCDNLERLLIFRSQPRRKIFQALGYKAGDAIAGYMSSDYIKSKTAIDRLPNPHALSSSIRTVQLNIKRCRQK